MMYRPFLSCARFAGVRKTALTPFCKSVTIVEVISRGHLVFGFDDTSEDRCPSLQVKMTCSCSGSGTPELQKGRRNGRTESSCSFHKRLDKNGEIGYHLRKSSGGQFACLRNAGIGPLSASRRGTEAAKTHVGSVAPRARCNSSGI